MSREEATPAIVDAAREALAALRILKERLSPSLRGRFVVG